MADIKRRTKIKVKSSSVDNFGNLKVVTEKGNEVKIAKKREGLFDFFQDGAEVTLGYSEYMNKEYVAEATPSAQIVSTDTPVEDDHMVEEAKKMGATTERTSYNEEKKDRSMAVSYAKDEFCAGKIKVEEIKDRANFYIGYILNK